MIIKEIKKYKLLVFVYKQMLREMGHTIEANCQVPGILLLSTVQCFRRKIAKLKIERFVISNTIYYRFYNKEYINHE